MAERELGVSLFFGSDEYTAHYKLPEPDWWACSEPERPADGDTCYRDNCPRCLIKAKMTLKMQGDIRMERIGMGTVHTLTMWITEQEAKHGRT